MIRRAFLRLGLVLAGFGRRAWAQAPPVRWAPLSRPVRIPAERLRSLWEPVPFTAEATAPAAGAVAARRVLISGVVFRRSAPAGSTALSALCLTCPHEQCRVDLIRDPAQLVKMTGVADHHPVFECGCHFSVFDAREDGARLAGETPRGLYRFRIAAVADGIVEIGEVEADALTDV